MNVILSGFPAFTPFQATLEFDGKRDRSDSAHDHEDGSFDSSTVGFVGNFEPVTFTATIIWAGGTLTESLFVDCSQPASKQECTNSGWQHFPQFKNQGQCIAFVKPEARSESRRAVGVGRSRLARAVAQSAVV